MPTSLPADKTALLLIDLQNCYLDNRPLKETRTALIKRINQLIDQARRANVPIVFARTRHNRDKSTWTRNMLQDDQGFAFNGDRDEELVPELDATTGVCVFKTRDNAFYATELGEILEEYDASTLVLAGVSTHTCVAATAAEAYARDLVVVLAADAIASDRPDIHEHVIGLLHDEYRQPVAEASEIRFEPGGWS